MNTLHFQTTINAARKDVWNTMISQDTYRIWTSPFTEGSYYEGSWKQGERIRFMAPNGGGMVAVIAENIPYEFLSIKHLGFIQNGVEDTESDEVKKWAPCFENYAFSGDGNITEIEVTIDVAPEWEEHMQNTWPKALAKLKEICEAPSAQAAQTT